MTAAIQITYTAGYATLPPEIAQAMLLMIGSWYEHREQAVIGTTVQDVPMGARWLLEPYRVVVL